MKLKQYSVGLLVLSAGAVGLLTSATNNDGGLQAGLDSIKVESIRSDLHFIASDELQGRDTPSDGLRKAARFIRARLQRLAFEPAGSSEGSFFHLYNLAHTKINPDETMAMLRWENDERHLTFGKDYYFRSGIANLELGGEVVFVGGGHAEDVEDIDLSDRWAFAYQDGLSEGECLKNVRARGAIGVIFSTPPGDDDRHSPERASRIAGFVAGRTGMRVTGERIFPTIYMGVEAAESMAMAVAGELEPGMSLEVDFQDLRMVAQDGDTMELENVGGLFRGSDPDLANEVIIISAHYDHVGVTGDEIFNGADDNGSGTVGMMALAEALVANGPLKRSVLLLWVSGEEKGLLGSEAWTLSPTLPEGMRAVCNLNIDMIGRNAPDYLLITPTADHAAYNGLTRMAEKFAPMEGFPKLGSCDQYWMRSDHMNFSVNMGIPVAFLFSDVHADYHKSTDTIEKIDYDKIHRVCRLVLRMVVALSSMDLAEL